MFPCALSRLTTAFRCTFFLQTLTRLICNGDATLPQAAGVSGEGAHCYAERMSSSRGRRRQSHLDEVASLTLGIEDLTDTQEEAIESILSGHDTLAIMPTGSGKSAIYQVAANLLPGPTVVISPLIALQQDQVAKLEQAETGEAALLNSTVTERTRLDALEAAGRGDLEFLFLAPEQLANEAVLRRLIEAKPSLLVIDEAHCISSWGHDFRPDYLALGDLVGQLQHPVVLALTATASTPVQEEIIERLAMREARIVTQNLDRPNIHLEVRRFDDDNQKRQALVEAVVATQPPGIVYTATRGGAEELTKALSDAGVNAACYHAGLAAKTRELVHRRFMDAEIDVVVATKAFGMGVDKADVRFVFHSEVSDSLDSYMQEIGRGGRDRKAAKALLFYQPSDLGIQRFFAGSRLAEAEIAAVLRAFRTPAETLTRKQVAEASGLGERRILRILNGLVDAGLLRKGQQVGAYRPVRLRAPGAGMETIESLQEQWQQVNESRVEMMRLYAEAENCRRQVLLSYFGEQIDGTCGNCDNCERGVVDPKPDGVRLAHVSHKLWGLGRVLRQEADRAVVFFESVGYKTLDLNVALERGLLTRVQDGASLS